MSETVAHAIKQPDTPTLSHVREADVPAFSGFLFFLMEDSMKKFVFLIAALAAVGLGPPSAFACGDMCVDDLTKVTVGGNANFGGFGGGMFIGPEGMVKVDKAGYAFTEVIINAGGSLCGASCQDGSFTFTGAAGERVDVTGWAKSTTPGATTSVVNEGAAFSNVTSQFGKVNTTAPR